jgi:beta-galactosidase
MKKNGFNAIRTSHNPPSPAFLDACDRLGMLVVDEAFDQWEEEKNPDDYHLDFPRWWQRDMSSMILRDRNHPSVIMWSIGNEIPERLKPRGIEIAKDLSAFAKKLDPTRPITAAINNFRGDPIDNAFQYLDVGGYNYMITSYEEAHARFPQRVILGTESFPRLAFQSWQPVEKLSYVIGDFVWTGMDHLGESAIGNAQLDTPRQGGPPPANAGSVSTQQAQTAAAFGGAPVPPSPFPAPGAVAANSPAAFFMNGSSIRLPFPWFNSYCGDIDLVGETKPQGYYRRVLWGMSKIEMAIQRPVPVGRTELTSGWGWSDELRSWTWPGFEGRPLKVRLASVGDQVRLTLNGKEIGTKSISRETEFRAEFEIPYTPGELKAVALQNGREIGDLTFTTAGKPARLQLKADRSSIRHDPNDLSFVKVEVLDQAGSVVPDAVVSIALTVSGAGRLAAAGTANPKDVSSFRSRVPRSYHGRCLAIVQPNGGPGSITLTAESAGIESATLQLTVV